MPDRIVGLSNLFIVVVFVEVVSRQGRYISGIAFLRCDNVIALLSSLT